MYDKNLEYNLTMISQDFGKVLVALMEGKTVIFPADGFGTGLALLSENAPITLAYVKAMTNFLIEAYG